MYCSIEDIRNEGVTDEQADDAKLENLIKLACNYIDTMTGQFFEPREQVLRLDGRGGKILRLPVFLIEAYSVIVSGEEISDYVLYNRMSDRFYPKIYRNQGWRKGILNISVQGLWGYVDKAETGYATPELIKRAAMKLALYNFPDLGDKEAQAEKALSGLLQSETTDGHSYSLNGEILKAMYENSLTGDAEIDGIINQYTRYSMELAVV
ncbi:MAG: hypothetical protein IJ667_04940 [Synergistaceae bacterium]|nr:hypothetical protein [Synergistaceae bacterium]